MKIFDYDGPLMRMLGRMADLLLLNLLTLICCIPVVTAGAAFTALHYMSLKLVRNEESYIVRGYFKSFIQNFRQATIIWVLILLAYGVIIGDIYIVSLMESFPVVFKVVILMVGVIVLFVSTFVFPVLAKFDNPVFRTLKNTLVISVWQFPKTVIMFVLNWLPWVLLLFFLQLLPISVFFGFVFPSYCSAIMYNKFFKKLEEQIEENNRMNAPVTEETEEDERIFKDEVDESGSIK